MKPYSQRRWRPELPTSALRVLACSRCSKTYDPDRVQHLCACGAPLLARYDAATAAATLTSAALRERPQDLWRFRELLPVRDDRAIATLGEQPTPLRRLAAAGAALGMQELFCKDEGTLPTGSFKARGAAVGVSRARELGVQAFVMPSNGNAAYAWAAYAGRAGMRAAVVLPARAPIAYRQLCVDAGAQVAVVDGLITDAGRVVARAVAAKDLYDASTLKEPYRIEGKKTLGFEIAEQFAWRLPDVIVYPTGGGVGLIGMHKAFAELRSLGWLPARMPRFIAVQSSGCAPIVKAWHERRESSEAWPGAQTVAFGINVPKAIGDFIVLRILRETGGAAIAVDDDAIAEYRGMLVERDGVDACLEGGAALAAVAAARREGVVGSDERVLVVNTGRDAPLASAQQPHGTPEADLTGNDADRAAHVQTIGPDGDFDITVDL